MPPVIKLETQIGQKNAKRLALRQTASDKVTLTGFGTFEARKRAERKGRDIRTKAVITIPASIRPVFTAGEVLKQAVHPKPVKKTAKPKAAKKPTKPNAKQASK